MYEYQSITLHNLNLHNIICPLCPKTWRKNWDKITVNLKKSYSAQLSLKIKIKRSVLDWD